MTTNIGVRARWLIAELAVEVDPKYHQYLAELKQLFEAQEEQLKSAEQALDETVKFEEASGFPAWGD